MFISVFEFSGFSYNDKFSKISMLPVSSSIRTLIRCLDQTYDLAVFAIPVSIELIINSLSIDFSNATASAILSKL